MANPVNDNPDDPAPADPNASQVPPSFWAPPKTFVPPNNQMFAATGQPLDPSMPHPMTFLPPVAYPSSFMGMGQPINFTAPQVYHSSFVLPPVMGAGQSINITPPVQHMYICPQSFVAPQVRPKSKNNPPKTPKAPSDRRTRVKSMLLDPNPETRLKTKEKLPETVAAPPDLETFSNDGNLEARLKNEKKEPSETVTTSELASVSNDNPETRLRSNQTPPETPMALPDLTTILKTMLLDDNPETRLNTEEKLPETVAAPPDLETVSNDKTGARPKSKKKQSETAKATPEPASMSNANPEPQLLKNKLKQLESATAASDLETVLKNVKKVDNTCSFSKCKKRIAEFAIDCKYCPGRFCTTHGLPEIHGCGEAVRRDARRQFLHPEPHVSKDQHDKAQTKLNTKLRQMEQERKGQGPSKEKKK